MVVGVGGVIGDNFSTAKPAQCTTESGVHDLRGGRRRSLPPVNSSSDNPTGGKTAGATDA
jgi:hypothetical protein